MRHLYRDGRPDTKWGRFCDRLEDAEDWVFDLPMLIGLPIVLGGMFLVVLAIIVPIMLFADGGPSCVDGTVRVTIESREMVTSGKLTHPGIVKRTVCIPEEDTHR